MAGQVLEKDLRKRINGEIVVFEKGMTHDEVRSRYQSLTGGFLSGLSAGLESLKGSVGAIPDVLVGDIFGSQEAIDQAGKEYEESDKARTQALPSATDYKDVISAYQRDGALGAIPEAYRFSAESIAQSIPYVAPSMVATKVGSSSFGLGIASYLAKATPYLARAAVSVPIPVLKAGLGVAAGVGTLALQFFGDNMQRQYETAKAENPEEQVTPEDLNTFSAALAAAPQAGMDYIVIALTGGAGRGPQIAAARSLKESLGAVGATAKASTFPTLGQAARASIADSAFEFPTEMLQTVLERAQAGLSISPQDAEFVEEMIATVAGTIPVAGAFGAYGTQRSYRANKKAYKDWEKLSEEEKVIRNDYEKRRESSVQAEYDNSVRMYGENVREVQDKFNEAGRESVENRRLIEQGVQEAKDSIEFSADDVFEAAESRNIKTDDKAFKAFVYRTTNGQTNDINEADQDALRAMRTILTGFTIQDYYDAETEEGVSVPSFTSEEFESVIKGLRSGSKITSEVVRKKLHDKFFSKAKGEDNLVDYTDSESSNDIASSIIEEMKTKGYAVENANGNVKARKPKYTEGQYRDLMERAYKDGSINLRDYEQITGRFGQNNFESFLGDAVVRGDMPQSQSSSMGDGEFAPLVFRAAFSEDAAEQGGNLEPVVGPDGRPVIRTSRDQQAEIKRRLTAGNTVTEVVGANGYFIRDENGQIVGGATSKGEANKEANFLNENRAKYKIIDQTTGNPTYGTKRKLNAIIQVSKGGMTVQGRAAGFPDYTGVTPELVEGSFSVDNSKSEGFAVRQFLSPGLKIKSRETGELVDTGESFGPRRPKVTEISFAPDVRTASSVEFEFAKEMMPGASNWDKKADEEGKTKRADLQQLFDDEGRQFRPPSFADVLQGEVLSAPSRPTEISKREKVLKAIPEGSRAKGEEVLKVIESKLKEANLDKALIGTVMERIEGVGTDGEVRSGEGSYSPNDDGFRRIAISLDQIKDANTNEEIRIAVASIMDHEIVHAMRDLDLFTIQEWNVLSTSAYRVKNKDGVTFFDQASQDYEGNNTEYIIEEAVAEMYRQYYSVPEVRRQIAGQPRTLIERMAIFMEKLYNAMSGAGFVTAADAISGMKKIQAREAGEVRTIQRDRNPLVSQAIEVEEAEEEVAGQAVAESVVSDTPTDPETRAELGRDPLDANADARTEDLDAERFSEPERLAFDRPYGYKVTNSNPLSFESMFVSDNGVRYQFNSDNSQGVWFTTFQAEGGFSQLETFGVTGEEKFGALRVLGTIRNILRDFITQEKPQGVYFTSSKSDGSGKGARSRIYKRGIEKIAKELNYDIEITEDSNEVQFDMSRKAEPVYNAEGERLSAVPLAPGTAPIPDGHFRFFHYTAADPNAIGREGIDISFARGHLDSEPDQIWATREAPEKVFKTFVEFSLPPDDPRIGGTISREKLGIDSQATFTGSINPENIIAVHERWHDTYRWIMNNPKKLEEVLDGKHDRLLTEDSPAGRATSEIKNSARSEERLSTVPNQGSARNSYEIPRVNDNARAREDERSQRSVLIAEGDVEPERLSSTNRDRVKKREPRPDRDIEAIESQMFAPPNEESWFETTQKALFDPDKRKEWMTRFRMIFLDKYDYLAKVTREAGLKMKDNREILASTNSASLALLSDRANSIVAAAINNGALVLRGGIARIDPTKKSLKQALNPLFEKDEYLYRKWGTWMVANRAGRLVKNGMLTPLTSNEIDTINKDVASKGLLPMFEQVRNDYEQWNDALVDFMKDTGVINEDLARVFKKYGDYIPFYRNMDLDGNTDGEGGVTPEVFKKILEEEGIDLSLGANRRLKTLFPTLTDQNQPKKMKGGDMQLSDPLTGIMQNLRAAVVAGTKNLAAQRVMIDAVDAEMATEVFADSDGTVDAGAYTVRVNGEEKYFTTTDRLLIDTLTAFTQGKVNVWPLFSMPANFLRESVSRSPLFMARNLVRDSMSVWVTSGANMTPVIDTMKKFTADLQGKGDSSYSILENSGVVGGYEYVFEPKAFEKDFRKKMRREGMTLKAGSADTVRAVFPKIWDKLGETSQMSDAATRQVIYEDTLQVLLNKGVGRAEAESEAIFQAMETLNFSRRGNSAVLSAIMTAVPFLNARMQGLDVMYRGARGRYQSNRGGENNALKSILARGGMIAFATWMYTLLSHEDDEYKGASETVRDQNWLIFGLRIPIPFEVGLIFKTGPERITRLFLGDDTLQDGFDALLTGLINTFELPITGPQALAPLAEVLVNKNWFTGRPVVPEYLGNRPSGEQYKYYTAEYAKALGETFNVSPLKIEHILNGYSGTMGSYLLSAVDSIYKMANGIPIMMDWRPNEVPVVGALFQSAEASTGQMQRWSDLIFSVRGMHASLAAARKEDPERYERLNERYGDIISVKPRLDRINTRIDKLRSARKAVYLSRTMSDSDKRREFDSIDKRIKETLKGTEEYRDLMPGPIPFFRDIN